MCGAEQPPTHLPNTHTMHASQRTRQLARLAASLALVAGLAAAAPPAVKTVDGNLEFEVADGNRVGYKAGGKPVVYFDKLSSKDETFATLLESLYMLGKDKCKSDAVTAEEAASKREISNKFAAAANDSSALGMRMTVLEKAVKASAEASASADLYWFASQTSPVAPTGYAPTVLPANSKVHAVMMFGVGFAEFYHPSATGTFQCVFTSTTDKTKKATSAGKVSVAGPPTSFVYHLECPAPPLTSGKFAVSAIKFDGKTVPFRGFSGANELAVSYSWSSASIAEGAATTVTGIGFDVDKAYRCYVEGVHYKSGGKLKVTALNSAAKSGLGAASATDKLNCGAFPAGNFKVASGKGTVTLSVFEVDDKGKDKAEVKKAAFLKSASFQYNACLDGTKSGDETDVDCGGATCGKFCAKDKACAKDTDCDTKSNYVCKSNKCASSKKAPAHITTWAYPPLSSSARRYDDNNYKGYQHRFYSQGRLMQTAGSYEYPIYYKKSLRSSVKENVAFQLYQFKGGGKWFNNLGGGGQGSAFQMGFVWQSISSLHPTNTLHATSHLRTGNGVYLTIGGNGKRPMYFFNGGSSSNRMGIGTRNREAYRTVDWGDTDKLTMIVRGEAAGPSARSIEVYIAEKLVYTFKTKAPAGQTALYFYVGIGYRSPSANWNHAQPSFRMAKW